MHPCARSQKHPTNITRVCSQSCVASSTVASILPLGYLPIYASVPIIVWRLLSTCWSILTDSSNGHTNMKKQPCCLFESFQKDFQTAKWHKKPATRDRLSIDPKSETNLDCSCNMYWGKKISNDCSPFAWLLENWFGPVVSTCFLRLQAWSCCWVEGAGLAVLFTTAAVEYFPLRMSLILWGKWSIPM